MPPRRPVLQDCVYHQEVRMSDVTTRSIAAGKVASSSLGCTAAGRAGLRLQMALRYRSYRPARSKRWLENDMTKDEAEIRSIIADHAKARHAKKAERGKNPFVFAGRPQRPLSNMALAMLLRRMDLDVTAHGMRTSFRTWCSEVAHVEFELAELCLSHRVGSAVSRAYNRTTMLERRRPVMQAWSDCVTGKTSDNVIALKRDAA
jgi:integrase